MRPTGTRTIRLQAHDPFTITASVAEALLVVARHDGYARLSNQTDHQSGLVYWSAVDGLLAAGLARWSPTAFKQGRVLETTALGRRVCRVLEAEAAS